MRIQVVLADQYGTPIEELLPSPRIDYVKTLGDIWQCTVTIPRPVDTDSLLKDQIIKVYLGQPEMKLDFMGFLSGWKLSTDRSGADTTKLFAEGPNALLKRRYIVYAEGSSQSKKTDYADDMMKEIVRENLGSNADDFLGTGSARDLTGNSGVTFGVQSDASRGPSFTKSFAWQNVLSVLQSISDASWALGTPLYFGIVPTESGLEFVTGTGQLGIDRTVETGASPTIISQESGNLLDIELSVDYSRETNVAYVGGKNTGTDRDVRKVIKTDRLNASQWARSERFINASGCDSGDDDCIDAYGKAAVMRNRPIEKLSGTLVNSPSAKYKTDWDLGDKLTAVYKGRSYSVLVKTVRVQFSPNDETVQAVVETGV